MAGSSSKAARLLLPALLLLAAYGSNTAASSSPTAYEMLERYDFPRGILPEGVTGYELRPNGSFEVYLPRACEFLLSRSWLVRYDARLSGTAAAGRLTSLNGVSVKVLFFWVPVGEVDRAGDQLSFYVGPVATSFPIADFADSPHCRGYDAW
jgi:hypothetical protein